jgi:phosphate acetyltransferase
VLVVTPGDRDDIILAVSLAAINGVPLAGLLLTSDTLPDPRIMDLCRGALQAGLPVLSVSTGSYDTANQLNSLNKEIPVDDRERARSSPISSPATSMPPGCTSAAARRAKCACRRRCSATN